MRRPIPVVMISLLGVLAVALLSPGCRKGLTATQTGPDLQGAVDATAQAMLMAESVRKDGARTWEQNCMRCHNLRPPNERSDREWEIIVHHMRVRANLTAEEHRLILDFLKSAN